MRPISLITALGIAAALGSLPAVAPAILILNDDLDYTAGDLDSQGFWNAPGTFDSVITGTMTYTEPNSFQVLSSGGTILNIAGTTDEVVATKFLSSSISSSEFLVSMLIRFNGTEDLPDVDGFPLPITGTDFLQVFVNNGTAPGGPSFGIKTNTGSRNDGIADSEDFFARVRFDSTNPDGVANTVFAGELVEGDTYLLIASFSKSTAGAPNPFDTIQLWVNPPFRSAPATRPMPDVSLTDSSATISSVNTIGIRVDELDSGDSVDISRLRVATTWWEVYDDTGTLFVDLESFTAETAGPGMPVTLEWETSVEVDNVGFNIVREINGTREQLNGGLIAPLGDEFSGSVYTFTDTTVDPGWDQLPNYYLEDLDLYGKTTTHGPAAYKGSGTTDVVDWALYE